MSKTNYPLVKVDWNEIEKLSTKIAKKLIDDKKNIDLIVPILRGGMPSALFLSSLLKVEEMSCIHIRRSINDNPNTSFKEPICKGITNADKIRGSNILIVDDTLVSIKTFDYAIELINKYNPKSIEVAILYNFNKDTFDSIYSGEEVEEYKWIIFPWEDKKLDICKN